MTQRSNPVPRVPPRPDEGSRPRRGKGLAWREVDGRVLLLSRGATELVRLNATGSFLWLRMDGRKTVRELAGELATAHQVDPDNVLDDVVSFLVALAEAGLASW